MASDETPIPGASHPGNSLPSPSTPIHSPDVVGSNEIHQFGNLKSEKLAYGSSDVINDPISSDGIEVQEVQSTDSNVILTTIDNSGPQTFDVGSPSQGSERFMINPSSDNMSIHSVGGVSSAGNMDINSDQQLIVVTTGAGGDNSLGSVNNVESGYGESNTISPGQRIEIEVQPETMVCMVCEDKGSGYHYSVYSCEGCKGFFKRSVQKNLNYMCKENKTCPINKYTRNNCQYCRFMKCLKVGMKREAVREDRTPGGGRHGKGGKRPRLEDPNIITTIINNSARNPADDEMIQKLLDAKPDMIPCAADIVPEGGNTSQIDINSLMQYGYMELRLIIEWARKVPGFSDLLIEDQMALLKGSFMELNVLRLSYRSLNCEGGVKFAQGLVLTPEQSADIGWGHDLTNCSLEFISKLKEIPMDNTEFCILNAIVLTYPDAMGVRDKDAVIKLQSQILDGLRKYTVNKYPDEPRRFGKMLLRLPALRTVSAIAAERFLSMSLDGNIKMNALVLEMMS